MEKQAFERPIIQKLNAGLPSKYGLARKLEPISHIDGVAISSIIKQYGSPVFIFSENTIRRTYKDAYRAFSSRYPKVQFAWSYKTNYLNAICQIFHQEGAWAEVVSGFEYDKAIANGIPSELIIFNGPDKSLEDLRKAIINGSLIHIDHFDELYDIIKLSKEMSEKPRVAIRVNMDVGIYPKWDRFGFNYENGEAWDALNRIMASKKLELVGLHTHIGTYIMSTEAYKIAASKLAKLAVDLEKKYGLAIQYIDIGGGFASKNTLRGSYYPGTDTAPSFDDFAEAITSALLSSDIKPQNLPLLILETGRALIDEAGYLAGTVLANKRLSDGRRATIIDAGVNVLFTAFWYEHDIRPVEPISEQSEDTTIYGPLCMNIDVVRYNVMFPLLKKGDHYVIRRVGAYNNTQWLQFINMRPNIVLIDKSGNLHLIRKKETLDTINSMEVIPEHLKENYYHNMATK
ncbi:diaminopimelate decarboxylase [Thermaurantimonas aggregans]|uniref:Diaminopimelate decarboxylase n=1 Tax=Thermaurantimonas aggregans TaxID=2173829 RepID=A0A401XKP5_9FLAO|nr:alanine racemase [Thermaurantimonas aggregans]MCX8147891.1 alanine racemase [Thermaurantimonas aggregans]GCD77554.1 diaminopimelate decarboxylase [Thermaurantimonas aggregans]